jgi:hypothetical protein
VIGDKRGKKKKKKKQKEKEKRERPEGEKDIPSTFKSSPDILI